MLLAVVLVGGVDRCTRDYFELAPNSASRLLGPVEAVAVLVVATVRWAWTVKVISTRLRAPSEHDPDGWADQARFAVRVDVACATSGHGLVPAAGQQTEDDRQSQS